MNKNNEYPQESTLNFEEYQKLQAKYDALVSAISDLNTQADRQLQPRPEPGELHAAAFDTYLKLHPDLANVLANLLRSTG
jgi:hypothetical protein